MKILITGSTGLVGSEATKLFSKKGCIVIGLDSNMRSYFFGTPRKKAQYNIDIRDEKKIEELFKKHKFDAIVHTAAQPSHDWAKKEPLTDFDINTRGTLVLLEATRKYCPKAVFVHVSTDKVYGDSMKRKLVELKTRWHSNKPFDETISIDSSCHSLFGVSKTAGDLYVQEYGYYFGIKTGCFRPGCITGAEHEGAEEHGFLSYLAKCIKEGKPYTIFGYKGKQVRDQIHAYDLVNAFWHFIKKPRIGAVYNIGGGPKRSFSVLEAINMIEKRVGKKAIVRIEDKPRLGDRQWAVHDVSKFKKDYPDWKYRYSLDDIIDDVCNK